MTLLVDKISKQQFWHISFTVRPDLPEMIHIKGKVHGPLGYRLYYQQQKLKKIILNAADFYLMTWHEYTDFFKFDIHELFFTFNLFDHAFTKQ